MENPELKEKYLNHLTSIVQGMDYSYADGFFEEEECTDEEVEYLLSLNPNLYVEEYEETAVK